MTQVSKRYFTVLYSSGNPSFSQFQNLDPFGGNSVKMGEKVRERLDELESMLPLGIELNGIYFEDEVAVQANNDFIVNLIISIGIVVFLILLAMGVRAGILIGTSLIFTIMGTLMFMMPAGT